MIPPKKTDWSPYMIHEKTGQSGYKIEYNFTTRIKIWVIEDGDSYSETNGYALWGYTMCILYIVLILCSFKNNKENHDF